MTRRAGNPSGAFLARDSSAVYCRTGRNWSLSYENENAWKIPGIVRRPGLGLGCPGEGILGLLWHLYGCVDQGHLCGAVGCGDRQTFGAEACGGVAEPGLFGGVAR